MGLLPVGLVCSAAFLAGCDSTPDVGTPEAQKAIATTKENIQKTEDAANAQNKKAGGSKAGVMKSMKGNMGAKPAAE